MGERQRAVRSAASVFEWLTTKYAAARSAWFSTSNSAQAVSQPFASAEDKNQGDRFLKEGRLDEAFACYQRALATGVKSELLVNIGFIHLSRSELSAAEAVLQEALALGGTAADAHYLLGSVMGERQDHAAAAACFEQAIATRADFEAAHEGLSRSLLAAGHFRQAEATLQHATALFPESSTLR